MNNTDFPDIPIVLQYHNVTPHFKVAGTWVTPRQFYFHLKEITDMGFHYLNPHEIIKPTVNHRVLITFDDAFEDVYRYAFPLMERMGFRGIIFVVADSIGKYNTWDATFGRPSKHMNKDQLKDLISAGWALGSHSLSHPDLTMVPKEILLREVGDSKKKLEDMFGVEVPYFSYPYGKYNMEVIEAVRSSGYMYGFCSKPWVRIFDPMTVPRQSIYLIDIFLSLRLDRGNPLWKPLGYLQILINSFASLSGLARHRFPLLAKIAHMQTYPLSK